MQADQRQLKSKLWKNPQARREVIAQIIEYAALLKRLQYSDLAARLKKYIPTEADPECARFKDLGIEFDEPRLLDRIAQCLSDGDFHLISAGDGMRSNLVSITENMNFGSLVGELSLVEVPIYKNDRGEILVESRVPSEHRLFEKRSSFHRTELFCSRTRKVRLQKTLATAKKPLRSCFEIEGFGKT